MKLTHPDYTFNIEFRENIVNKIVIESPNVLSDIILDLMRQYNGGEGRWILSQNGEIIKVSEQCELVLDIFNVDLNQKKMINNLYKLLENEIQHSDKLNEWRIISANILGLLERTICDCDYNVCYKDEIEIKDILKIVDVRFERDSDNLCQHLIEYIELSNSVKGTKIFILVNISSFLTNDEINHLYTSCLYNKTYLLLLENTNKSILPECEHVIVVDQDNCVIQCN